MRRHVILTSGRSGSNALVDLLNHHHAITNYGEVLGEWMPSSTLHQRVAYGGRRWESYVDFCLSSKIHFALAQAWSATARTRRRRSRRSIKRWSAVSTIGMKEFSDHLIGYHLHDYLNDRQDIQVIHLRRHNVVQRALSVVRLRATRRVANINGHHSRPLTVPIPPFMSVLDDLALGDAREDLLVDRLDQARVLRLSYERLFASPQDRDRQIRRVYEFLGVDPDVSVHGTHSRLSAPTLHDAVANADELIAALRGSRYEEMVHE